MTDVEEVATVRSIVHDCREATAAYEIAFSENNPSISFKDGDVEDEDLKTVFAQLDPSSPIKTESLNRARNLCSKYLGGAWANIGLNEFKFKAVTGGMSNLLFLVQLPDNVKPIGTEPAQALLRVFCQDNVDQLVTESVVFTLLSERELGPRLLGVFPGGRFEQYIPSRPLLSDEISDQKFSNIIAPMIARIHTLDVPITKEPELISTARDWLRKFRRTAGGQKPIVMKTTAVKVDEKVYPAVLTVDDLEKEWDFIEEFLAASDSPLVFSHNDLQKGNILIKENHEIQEDGSVKVNGQKTDVHDPLVLIDFEYCNYNHQGFDLGNHLCEFGFDYDCDVSPYYKVYQDRFDIPERRQQICSLYVDEIYKMSKLEHHGTFPTGLITGDREADIKKLEEAAFLFMPISHLFWVAWALFNAESSYISFDYGAYGRDRLALYYERKAELEAYIKRK